ncbi:MAG: 3-oxoacyl-ACP reductase FabG [Proteobacteria bacterium]|nr:3-oxoacyl-ACP reductase FabG [Pseudomonadota bacterium]
MLDKYKDKVVLVTGASRGIGKAIATKFAEQGAFVIGTATTEKSAVRISKKLEANHHLGSGFVLNIADTSSVDEFSHKIKGLNAPNILVNNAGMTRDNLLLRMKDDEWDDVINTNLTGMYRITKLCLRAMVKARYGRIINITSVVGLSGNPGQTNYSAAKAGMIGFTRSLAREIGSRGITVNAVAPGFIETDMTRELDDEVRDSLQNQIALGRLGRPEEIATVIDFLASDEAAYITGQTISVNGGMHMA